MAENIIFVDYQDDKSAILHKELSESNKKFIYFKYLKWDSDFFGRACYLLDISKSKFTPSKEIKIQIEDKFKKSFITAKIDTQTDYSITYFLQKCGFYYVDTEVELKLTKQLEMGVEDTRFHFEEKSINSDLPYDELGSVFEDTRFHTDPNIANLKADALWINYIKTYKLTPNNRMFVAYLEDKACGIILSNVYNDKTVVFFVSVLKEFQNKNIGSAIMRYSLKQLGSDHVYTETQIKNLKALNFYIKNGFSLINKTMTILHRWK